MSKAPFDVTPKTRRTYWLVFAISLLLAAYSLSAAQDVPVPSKSEELYRQLQVFGDVLEKVHANYVEKPNDAKLIEGAINGLLQGLDPHSSYLDPKGFRNILVETEGEFGGLGLQVTMENGLLKVVAPLEDTPASRAGILSGDVITHLDKQTTAGIALEEAVEKMRGAPDLPITLTIQREGLASPLEVTLVREVIHIKPVKYEVLEDVAYVRIAAFNEHTRAELDNAISTLTKKLGRKLKGYILDLRNNPGGLLEAAVSASDAFLDRGTIVSTRGRNEVLRADARPGDITEGKKLVVLINGGTASAAEIVAGALQDYHRGIVVGTRSFGKGSVQTILPLSNGGALRFTTARYYTPSGRSIQAMGIKPDIVVEQRIPEELKAKVTQDHDSGEASLRGHLKHEGDQDSKAESGSSSFVPDDKAKDTQLQKALDLLHGAGS